MELLQLTTWLLFALILLVYYYVLKRRSWKLPPSPWGIPIIGHIQHMVGAGLPHRALHKLSLKYGPLFYLKLGHIQHIIVSSPEAAKEITKQQDLNFASRPKLKSAAIMTYDYKDIAFAPYGPYWRQLRKLCITELLSPQRVKAFGAVRDDEISELVSFIDSVVGKPLNLTQRVVNFTNTATSRAAFGTKCKHGLKFMEATKKAIELGSGFGLADLFPHIEIIDTVTRMSAKVKEAHREVDAILDQIIEEHQVKRSSKDDHEQDIVDVLLDLKGKPELDFPFTNSNIKAVIFDLFTGGTDTSSSTIVWAMAELMRKPETMKKAQTEVREVFKGKQKIQVEDIESLDYLKMVVKETLRLHPPLPLCIPRICTKACQIWGYDIPEGFRVIINGWAINRDPRYWEDAESFRPERFEGRRIDYKGNNFELLAFGSGRRMCPGMSFGLANVEVPLSLLLFCFDWELPHGMKAQDLDMADLFGATMCREKDLWLVARRYIHH